jgi:large repetitive protein
MSRSRRSILRTLAQRFFRKKLNDSAAFTGRRIRVEKLEDRQLMANDLFLASNFTDPEPDEPASNAMSTSGLQGEGEAQNDLVAFAKALRDAGVQFFGAAWCVFCNEQKQLFQDGYQFLPFVEVTNPDRTPNATGIAEGIDEYPTWEFQDGSRLEGVQTLATLATRSGIAIPQSSTPSAVDISNQTVLIGSPLHVPVDAYDPNGNPLTITVTSNNTSVVTAEVLQGNRSLRFATEGFGDMVFELFDSEAARPANRIADLVNTGFYNQTTSNKIIFHRVLNNFVIQAGDPTGTGSGGSTLGDFDDQFDVDLQHNRTGILSYAKAGDDTNDSQFFITEGPQRSLDFNHSVFGQLVEGEIVRDAISNTSVNSPSVGRPTNEVIIKSASIFNDAENGMLRLKGVSAGSALITVSIADNEGNTIQKTFNVTVAPDTVNSYPFLNPVADVSTAVGTPVNIQLSATDVEGDPVTFDAQKVGSVNYTLNTNSTTGLVTVTPPAGFTGSFDVRVRVKSPTAPTGATDPDPFDTQLVTVTVGPNGPTSVDLTAASDTGTSSTDNITNAGSMTFEVAGTTSGATVELKVNNTVVGSAVASGTTTTITTSNIAALGAGTYQVVATQTVGSQQSSATPALTLVFDNTQPVELTNTGIPATISAAQPLSVNLSHAEEGTAGLIYALTGAPTGMTIDAATGALAWTPTAAQVGAQNFTVKLTDKAGNVRNQNFSLTVAEAPLVGIELKIVDLNNNPITSIPLNTSFKVQVIGKDLRDGNAAQGLFAVYLDMLYNTNLIELDPVSTISHGTIFTNGTSTNAVLTGTAGLINELGGFTGSLNPTGADPKVVAEVRFKAKAVGNATFTAESADGDGTEILVFGNNNDEPVELSRVSFGNASLAVGIDFTAVNDTVNFDEDSTNNTINVLSNDPINSGSGAVLTIKSVGTTSAGGTVTIASDSKTVRYSPLANFNGSETFTYVVQNQSGAELTATVTVQVQPVNDAPVATNDSADVVSGSSNNTINVLANDNDGPDTGETLAVSAIGTPSQGGSVTIGPNGTHVVYTPRAGFVGAETFSYTLRDNGGATATATVTVNVKSSAPSPVVVADSFTVAEDAAQAEFNVLSNDTPGEAGETLSINSATATSGTVSVSTDGTKLRYTPRPNFVGSDIVTYVARGTKGGTATGTATFTVTAVNDAPTAVNDSIKINSSSATSTVDVLSNDTNVDTGETLTITAVTQPASGKGTVAISTDKKSLIYTPPSNSFTDSAVTFSYTLSDGSALTSSGNVSLEVINFRVRKIEGIVEVNPASSVALNSIKVKLTGKDNFNASVDREVSITDGKFSITDLAPGRYTVQVPELPFMIGGKKSINIVSNANDADSTGNVLSLGEIDARYIDIRDFLGKSLGRGFHVAAQAGQTQHWLAPEGSWKTFKSLNATLNDTTLALSGTRADNTSLTNSISTTDKNRVEQIASTSGATLYRVYVEPSDLTTTTPTTTTPSFDFSQLQGEGEGPSATSPNAVHNASGLSSESARPISRRSTLASSQAQDAAIAQVASASRVVSPAGDFIASQRATGQDRVDPESVNSAFRRLNQILDSE